MSESIISKSLFRLLDGDRWQVDSFEFNHHYQTGEVIACSVYASNRKALKSKVWIYMHEQQIIDGTDRGNQISVDKP